MEENINLDEIVQVVKDGCRLILISILITTLISAVITFFVIKPKYQTSTKVYVGKEIKEEETKYSNEDIGMYQKLMKTYVEVVKSKDVIKEAITNSNIDISVGEVLEGISVTAVADTSMLEIRYISEDPANGLELTLSIREAFIKKAKTLVPNAHIKTVQEAEYITTPISPNKALNVLLGILIGAIVGVGILFTKEFFNNTYKTKESLERNLDIPVLGAIPKM